MILTVGELGQSFGKNLLSLQIVACWLTEIEVLDGLGKQKKRACPVCVKKESETIPQQ